MTSWGFEPETTRLEGDAPTSRCSPNRVLDEIITFEVWGCTYSKGV